MPSWHNALTKLPSLYLPHTPSKNIFELQFQTSLLFSMSSSALSSGSCLTDCASFSSTLAQSTFCGSHFLPALKPQPTSPPTSRKNSVSYRHKQDTNQGSHATTSPSTCYRGNLGRLVICIVQIILWDLLVSALAVSAPEAGTANPIRK